MEQLGYLRQIKEQNESQKRRKIEFHEEQRQREREHARSLEIHTSREPSVDISNVLKNIRSSIEELSIKLRNYEDERVLSMQKDIQNLELEHSEFIVRFIDVNRFNENLKDKIDKARKKYQELSKISKRSVQVVGSIHLDGVFNIYTGKTHDDIRKSAEAKFKEIEKVRSRIEAIYKEYHSIIEDLEEDRQLETSLLNVIPKPICMEELEQERHSFVIRNNELCASIYTPEMNKIRSNLNDLIKGFNDSSKDIAMFYCIDGVDLPTETPEIVPGKRYYSVIKSFPKGSPCYPYTFHMYESKGHKGNV